MEKNNQKYANKTFEDLVQDLLMKIERCDQYAEGVLEIFAEQRKKRLTNLLKTHKKKDAYHKMARVGLVVKRRTFNFSDGLIVGENKQMVLVLYKGYQRSTTISVKNHVYDIKRILKGVSHNISDEEAMFYERLIIGTNNHRRDIKDIKTILKMIAQIRERGTV